MKQNYIYITLMGVVFSAFTAVFLFFPRGTYSALEKRELAKFPLLTMDNLKSGDFTKSVSSGLAIVNPFVTCSCR